MFQRMKHHQDVEGLLTRDQLLLRPQEDTIRHFLVGNSDSLSRTIQSEGVKASLPGQLEEDSAPTADVEQPQFVWLGKY